MIQGTTIARDKINLNFLPKYAETYSLIDDRRRKAFYGIYYSIAVLLILFSDPAQSIKIFDLQIKTVIIKLVSPVVILFLFLRYMYLCAHTLMSFSKYLNALARAQPGDESHQVPIRKLYTDFQRRDFSEHLNIFLFPRRYYAFASIRTRYKSHPHHSHGSILAREIIYKLFNWCANIANFASNAVPLAVYAYFVILLREGAVPFAQLFIVCYVVLGILAILLCLYYYFVVSVPRRTLLSGIYENVKMAAPELEQSGVNHGAEP